ncbi:GNAT family N-acetyltransferase [Candidatus Peregrinibacteria bacterium]|nr:GNAT family N-acetyltransferase [Candidatus Peregrinibacteria bacterium]
MVRLVLPSTKYRKSFLEAVKEFKKENNWYVLSVNMPIDEVAKNFLAYVRRVRNLSKGIGLVKGYVPETVYWLTDGKKFIGRASIRHRLTKHLRLIGGHIGYEVRPTERKKGYGKKILELALPKARKLGIKKVLVTCDETNTASRKIIEYCGGVFEDARSQGKGKPKKLRFWITN